METCEADVPLLQPAPLGIRSSHVELYNIFHQYMLILDDKNVEFASP